MKSGEKLEKVGKGGKNGGKWIKVGKSWKKWGKVGKSGEKLGKVGKGGEKCGKWGKVAKSWKKLEKVVKSGEGGKTCFLKNLDKMAAGGHFGCPKITFDHSSCHFRSIRNFFFFEIFGQNGRRRPFWIGRQCQLSNSSEIFG